MEHDTISLDEEVLRELNRYKSPSEHSVNCVLRRLLQLDLPENDRKLLNRASTEPAEYRFAILEALDAYGGSAQTTDIYEHVRRTLKDRLKPIDLEYNNDNQPRWKTAIRSETNSTASSSMRKQGLIEYDQYERVFRITDTGRRELERCRKLQHSKNAG